MEPAEYAKMHEMETSHWYFRGKYAVLDEMLRRIIPDGRKPDILDVGCGTGGMLLRLARIANASGIDTSPEAIAFCRARGIEKVRVASADAIPYPAGSFDAVCAFDILEHLDDESKMLSEIRRVLKPGGIVFITVPAFMLLWSEHDVALHHVRRYRSRDLGRLLQTHGFAIRRMSYFNSFLFPIAAIYRIIARVIPLAGRRKSDFYVPLPRFVNALCAAVFSFERHILKVADLPAGLSIFCAASPRETGA